mgnify:CR=1 FL=1
MKQLLLTKIVALILCFFSVSEVTAQMLDDVRINEIQVINQDGYKDAFGHAHSWIELFNTGYGHVNIGGSVLKVNGKEYRIPKTKDMVIGARGYAIFFADGKTDKGPYYTNFTLENTDFIELYAPDNQETPIDRISFNPADMKEDVTYGWFKDENGVEKVMNLPVITPGATNNTLESVHRSELFRQADPSGLVLTITAIAVVAVNLFLLYLIFKYMGTLNIRMARRKEEKAQQAMAKIGKTVEAKAGKTDVLTNEELAAIAIALYKYSEDLHDIEDTVLTINRAAKAYSPWSSKIYGLRQTLIKK